VTVLADNGSVLMRTGAVLHLHHGSVLMRTGAVLHLHHGSVLMRTGAVLHLHQTRAALQLATKTVDSGRHDGSAYRMLISCATVMPGVHQTLQHCVSTLVSLQ
jgi:hypothetical protein